MQTLTLLDSVTVQCSPSWWLQLKLRRFASQSNLARRSLDFLVPKLGGQIVTIEVLQRDLLEASILYPDLNVKRLAYTVTGLDAWKQLDGHFVCQPTSVS